ncbi:MAG: anhydro-N-acetylmuramic acid kinase [Acidiferrobacterales bacterium]
MNYIGLMSGTSLDAIDAVAISISSDTKLAVLATHSAPYPVEVKAQLQRLGSPSSSEFELVAQLDARLGELFASAANEVRNKAGLERQHISAVGSHGQTVRHCPSAQYPFSLQIGNPAVIAERTGIATVGDFRARDIAAGGQGAPLAPAFHLWMFHSSERNRAVVNIGGIANISCLPAQNDQRVRGFDTGPGNTLLDHWIAKHLGHNFDANGKWAATGTVTATLLERLCSDGYFRAAPPKSTGPEHFNLDWLQRYLAEMRPPPQAQDVQATLTELTPRTIAQALNDHFPSVNEIYVCGGGAHNKHLMARLRSNLSGVALVETTAVLGLDPDWVEAVAFAWLAHQAMTGQPGNLPSVTGARHEVILGGIYKA